MRSVERREGKTNFSNDRLQLLILPRFTATTISSHHHPVFLFNLFSGNLQPYPGRFELTSFIPEDTQSVVVQPIGTEGAIVFGHNQVRGFTRLDQAWLAVVADKIENTLEQMGFKARGSGFGKRV